ncbi:MAG: YaiO family outer membrane beta-barrel protein [Bacteroidota bacterium]|nr:YaiO family outer membrane beta-barrel protein [Bacteroidota bacterium]
MTNQRKNNFFWKISTAFFVIFFSQTLISQTVLDSLDSEELFARARVLAFNSQRDSARQLLILAMQESPTYADIRIFYARTLAWDGMRNEARKELRTVFSQKPFNIEALLFAIDVELWDKQPTEALKICVTALRKFPNNEEFLIQKAKTLQALNREEDALVTLSILEDINRSNPEIPKIRESIKSHSIMQGIEVSEKYDGYNKYYGSNHLLTIQYNRSTYLGAIIGRLNYRNTQGRDGFQVEVDAYPLILNGIYGYVNYGFAGSASSSLFPEHRAGLEVFFKLPSSFESSFGGRYLNFGLGNDIAIYTGSLEYYYEDFWFSLRPYITSNNISFSRSLNITSRWYYGGTAEEYASMRAGTGFSPDERNYDPSNGKVYFLNAQSFGVGWQKPFGIYSLLTIGLDYTKQEVAFKLGDYVQMYSVLVGYRYKF